MTKWICTSAMLAFAGLLGIAMPAAAAELPEILREDFEQGAARWRPFDPNSWKVLRTPKGHVYSLFEQSKYQPPHRSPLNIAILDDPIVGDFALEARLQSTVKDYDHRSMVLVFGYQDPAHFYYVHFGKKTDDHANQIFIVNDAPRVKISTKTTPGTAWDGAWHRIKITRNAGDGAIAVYFDDMQEPVMTATDTTFAWGKIGIGAFDDLGNFDDIVLAGQRVEPPAK
ncbi:MAG: hypothetical protein WD845_05940 [Pirellulales bacterium]